MKLLGHGHTFNFRMFGLTFKAIGAIDAFYSDDNTQGVNSPKGNGMSYSINLVQADDSSFLIAMANSSKHPLQKNTPQVS